MWGTPLALLDPLALLAPLAPLASLPLWEAVSPCYVRRPTCQFAPLAPLAPLAAFAPLASLTSRDVLNRFAYSTRLAAHLPHLPAMAKGW